MNIFPLHLLKSAEKSCIFVEIKSGETYNGTLEKCDRFMNIKLIDCILTTKDGNHFFKLPEIYIKGSSLKYFRLQEIVLDKAIDETPIYKNTFGSRNKGGKFRNNQKRNQGGGGNSARGKSAPARGKIRGRGGR